MDKNYDNEEKQIQGGIVHDLNLRQRVRERKKVPGLNGQLLF